MTDDDTIPDDVLALFALVADRGWRTEHGIIRDAAGMCPLCSLAHELTGVKHDAAAFDCAALDIGIGHDLAHTIVHAADGCDPAGARGLRMALGL